MVQSHVCVLIYIPFDFPCESNTQNADNRRVKIGMHLEIGREQIIAVWEDLGNPNFPHILFTSLIICNCDKGVITKSHMKSWLAITPFSSVGIK